MNLENITIGDVYTVQYCIGANFIDASHNDPYHEVYEIRPGEIFMILSVNEIEENNTVDIEILFEGKKMLFTFNRYQCIIKHVRRAESYDIPFMALQEVESGSNSSSFQIPHIPH